MLSFHLLFVSTRNRAVEKCFPSCLPNGALDNPSPEISDSETILFSRHQVANLRPCEEGLSSFPPLGPPHLSRKPRFFSSRFACCRAFGASVPKAIPMTPSHCSDPFSSHCNGFLSLPHRHATRSQEAKFFPPRVEASPSSISFRVSRLICKEGPPRFLAEILFLLVPPFPSFAPFQACVGRFQARQCSGGSSFFFLIALTFILLI